MIKKLKSRLRSDRGNAILILGLAILVIIALVTGLMADVAKSVQARHEYSSLAQKAALNGLKEQNSRGGMNYKAIESTVREYMKLRDGEYKVGDQVADTCKTEKGPCQVATAPLRAMCSANPDFAAYPVITLSFSEEGKHIDGWNGTSTEKKITYSNGQYSVDPSTLAREFNTKNFKKITIDVKEVSDNYFLSMFGRPCQTYSIKETARQSASTETNR